MEDVNPAVRIFAEYHGITIEEAEQARRELGIHPHAIWKIPDEYIVPKEILQRIRAARTTIGTVIMVGTATCGRAAGALEVLQAIKDELAAEHLDAHVVEVGCMGHCYAEPLVTIAKLGHLNMIYCRVKPEIARRLVRDYVVGEDAS